MSSNPKRTTKDVMCSRYPGHMYGIDFIPVYSPQLETIVSIFIFAVWIVGNWWHWRNIWKRFQFNAQVVEQSGLGWMKFKRAGRKGSEGWYDTARLVRAARESTETDMAVEKDDRRHFMGDSRPEKLNTKALSTPAAQANRPPGHRERTKSVIDTHGPIFSAKAKIITIELQDQLSPGSPIPTKDKRSLSLDQIPVSSSPDSGQAELKARLIILEGQKTVAIAKDDFASALKVQNEISEVMRRLKSSAMGKRLGTSMDDVLMLNPQKTATSTSQGTEFADAYRTPPLMRSGSSATERNPMAPVSGVLVTSSLKKDTQRSVSSAKRPEASRSASATKRPNASRSASAAKRPPTSRSVSTAKKPPASRSVSASKRPPMSRSTSLVAK